MELCRLREPLPARNLKILKPKTILGGSWDLVSMVISTLSADINSYKYSYLNYNPSY